MVGHTGDWANPDSRCVRVRVCKRCGDVTTEQEHTWSAFEYVAPNRCEQERRCLRCGTVESRVVHEWGPWRYVGPDSLQLKLHQEHVCSRCGVDEKTDFQRAF
jgi:hypothetical protein